MNPPRVMTIDSTEAAMGRWMKDFENTATPHFCTRWGQVWSALPRAAEDGRAQRAAHLEAGPVRNHQGQNAEDEGQRGHDDWPQTQLARLQGCLAARHAGGPLDLGELDDEDGVLAGQADQHHEAD